MATQDEVKLREMYVVSRLRKGYSRKRVAAELEDKFGLAQATCNDIVNRIGADLNRSLEALSEDAAKYIYNVIVSTIDDTLDDNDRKNRLRALELLSKVCKVTDDDKQTDVHINFGFSFDKNE